MSDVLNRFETGEIIDGFGDFIGKFDDYVDLAQEASNDAESPRGFDVGVAGIAIRHGFREPKIFVGSNYKGDHGVTDQYITDDVELEGIDLHSEEFGIPLRTPKNCGEMVACLTAAEEDRDNGLFFVGFVIAATTDPKEVKSVDGIETKTVPPCGECTEVLHLSENTSRATLYTSTGFSPDDIYEIRKIDDLRRLHKRKFEHSHPKPSRLSPGLGVRAQKDYYQRIANTKFLDSQPSRTIAGIARQALLHAGRTA